MNSWRSFGWKAVAAVGALLAVGVAALWLALDTAPRVVSVHAVATADIERAHKLFKRHDPQRQRPGIVRLLAVEQSDVDLVLNHAARRWTGLAAKADLQQGRATLAASVPVPYTGHWANIEVTLTQSQGLPEISGLRDVPHSGEQIARRHPVCTLLVSAATPEACLRRLRAKAAQVRAWLLPDPTP